MKGGSELSELLQKLIFTEVHSVYKEIYLLLSNTIFNIFLFFLQWEELDREAVRIASGRYCPLVENINSCSM